MPRLNLPPLPAQELPPGRPPPLELAPPPPPSATFFVSALLPMMASVAPWLLTYASMQSMRPYAPRSWGRQGGRREGMGGGWGGWVGGCVLGRLVAASAQGKARPSAGASPDGDDADGRAQVRVSGAAATA